MQNQSKELRKWLNACRNIGVQKFYFNEDLWEEQLTQTELAKLCGTKSDSISKLLSNIADGKSRNRVLRTLQGKLAKQEGYRRGVSAEVCTIIIWYYANKNSVALKTLEALAEQGIKFPPLLKNINVQRLAKLCGVSKGSVSCLISKKADPPQLRRMKPKARLSETGWQMIIEKKTAQKIIEYYAAKGKKKAQETLSQLQLTITDTVN